MSELKPCPFCGGTDIRTFPIRDGRKMQCKCGASPGPQFFGPLDKPSADERLVAAWNSRSDPRYEELLKLAEGMAAATSDLYHIGVCKARDALCAFLQRQKDTEHG